MDGAVVLSSDGSRIVRAAVHLMPDSTITTEESGTRHRTAERVARQTGHPVISVSQSMHIIGLYVNGTRHVIDDSAAILSRANQALATLERYKQRLDEVSGTLSALEIEDLVTARDAVAVVQRLEMVRRIADEIEGYVVELGTDGRLISLQLEELMAGVESDRTLVIRDYLPSARQPRTYDEAVAELDRLTANELIDLGAVAKAIGYPSTVDSLDAAVSPRGFRLLAKVPRLPGPVVDRLVDHFGSLQHLLGATVEDLQAVDGVGDARARGPYARACRGWPRHPSLSGTCEPASCSRSVGLMVSANGALSFWSSRAEQLIDLRIRCEHQGAVDGVVAATAAASPSRCG